MWQKLVKLAEVFRISQKRAKLQPPNYKLLTQLLVGVIVILALIAGYWRAKYEKLEEQLIVMSEGEKL